MTTVTHRGWCNSHIDDEDGLGFCSRESEPVDTFGIDITEDEDGLALDLWHPMRPGQGAAVVHGCRGSGHRRRAVPGRRARRGEGGEPKA